MSGMERKINFKVPVNRYNPSIVRDYNIAQGVSNPSDLAPQIIRDINIRYITVENSSTENAIGISIANSYEMNPMPPIKFSLSPGEIRHIGINPPGEQLQWVHMIDLVTKNHVGDPYALRTDANQFVLRDGINKWWVQAFKRSSYTATK
jgi:hypothetical protein